MRLWKVVVLVNLALGLGLGLGYLRWGREVRDLQREVAAARRAAAEAQARARSAERSWTAEGIVRSVLPRLGVAFITHEAIPDLMEGMTMGFEAEDPGILDGVRAGDPVRFTLVEKGGRLYLVAIEKTPRP
jgi:Cu/Ag efflux protein CusF